MGSESIFRLFSVFALGVVATACVAFQSSIQAPSTQAALSQSGSLSTGNRQPIEIEVNSLIEAQQINTGQFRPYELGTLKNFDDPSADPTQDPNL